MDLLSVNRVVLICMFLVSILSLSPFCFAIENLNPSIQMSVNETLVSSSQIFELGFFDSGNSSKRYLGIWYKKISDRKIVWVANREVPLRVSDSSASLKIDNNGNIRLADGTDKTVWSTNITLLSNKSEAVLLDTGNFVLRDTASGIYLWESFNFPGDTWLPSMMIGSNMKTGERRNLSSWKSMDDPSPGNFVVGITMEKPPEAFMWNGTSPIWRGGQWKDSRFIGIQEMGGSYLNGFSIKYDPQQRTQYITLNTYNTSIVRILVLSYTGSFSLFDWIDDSNEWQLNWMAPGNTCDLYGVCGQFGVCNKAKSPICGCLDGFVPKSNDEWSRGNWSSGCVRRNNLLCERNTSDMATRKQNSDGFLKLGGMKLPDFPHFVYDSYSDAGCKDVCMRNCSCIAYAFVAALGCDVWTTDLMDMQKFTDGGEDLFIRLANLDPESTGNNAVIGFFAALLIARLIALFGIVTYCVFRWRAVQRGEKKEITDDQGPVASDVNQEQEPLVYDFNNIAAATNNFSFTNKLGEGGFGPVYKGQLKNGTEIAVKRLSRSGGQGTEEFKNETTLISKLQHRNLVQILGFCVEGEEKLLIYEYMHNKSLDTFLFDSSKRLLLDWAKRYNIILGIAKGLLYLHRDSYLRVVHRDLKVSNILLDDNMNPKISDFGLARTFETTQDLANTLRIAGTLGYMAPEYAMQGIFSEKSDVFSFGVLLLEIVSSRKNCDYQEEHLNLLGYAWNVWSEDRILDVSDPAMRSSISIPELTRCIHVGLLCVQDHPSDRPAMPSVVQMLSTETYRPPPKEPSFTFQVPRQGNIQNQSLSTVHEITQSEIDAR